MTPPPKPIKEIPLPVHPLAPVAAQEVAVATTSASDENLPAASDNLPAVVELLDISGDERAGGKQVTRDDLAIPRLAVLQAQSRAITGAKGAVVIPEAKASDIYDSVYNKLYNGKIGIEVVIVHYRRTYVEWKPDRGGFVKDHGDDQKLVATCTENKRKLILPNGNELSLNAEFFVYLLHGNRVAGQAVIGMASTNLGVSRKMVTQLMSGEVRNPATGKMVKPAFYHYAWRLTTTLKSNDQGSWFVWDFVQSRELLDPQAFPGGQEIYLAARKFASDAEKGKVRVQEMDDAVDDGEGTVPF